jgi:DNA-3-methyladenine glycosylase
MNLVNPSFFEVDAVEMAKLLLGKYLHHITPKGQLLARITETEAYAGVTDRGSHAFAGRRTVRNEAMYGIPGTIYVYRCYGIHNMLNVVCGDIGDPQAVLIRSVEPIKGIDIMWTNRGTCKKLIHLTTGPGRVCQALAVGLDLNQGSFVSGRLQLLDGGQVPSKELISSPRVGIGYAEADALLPYRFYEKDEKWVSAPRIVDYPKRVF